uniref:RING-H2 finger protein ATL56-like n=1 Tax=Nicotiana sylvestris TaxID=4096 RepID=A0A1U7X011_NICSY|nr:PREDICTED: RING-H2 finger protein ATL56-like [Nicotiana sylvestris]XP_009782996.1 PREDICTED: RING-H2 finger protein ATL56-like [Nicotiana sylvestris]
MPIHSQNQETPNPNTKPKKIISLFIKCVIMALVLSLFLVFLLFLGFAALVLLHFLITSTAFHRRHRRRYHRRTSTTLSTTTTTSYDLPCVNYCGSQQTVKDCAICLEGFKEGELCRNLPGCGHLFHVKCVDSWLTRVLNCPICRSRVRVDSGNSGSVISDEDWKTWWAVGVSAG